MTVAACPVCQGASEFELYHPDADLYRCRACDHCFSHLPSLRNNETYGPEYFQEVHTNWFKHSHAEMYAMLWRHILTLQPHTRSLLDVGCGNAKFLNYLRSRVDWSLTGVDLSPQRPHEGIKLHQMDFADFVPPEPFDVVTSVMVVEHIANLREHLAHLVRCCRPGGLLVVLTIDERSILYQTARLLRAVGFKGPFERLYSIHHLNHFNASSLRTWLSQVGFVREQVHHNVPMDALDLPGRAGLVHWLQWLGVKFTFELGQLTSRTYAQTVFAELPEKAERIPA